ncbi:hypothetical protein [Lysinibacillus pakistanensis]|uniref:hypothetical protein n=1 Tax=Lysinibacillus pakistanensis TaxID=759811 RepID=UPI003D286FDF
MAGTFEEIVKRINLTTVGWINYYGIDHDDAMKIAYSRKGYWRLSRNEIIHQAITNKKLTKWGLKDITQLYELRYLRDLTAVYGTVRTVV